MTNNEVVGFQPGRRSLLWPAISAAAITTVISFGRMWRSSSTHPSWPLVIALVAGLFASLFVVFWAARLFRARREVVSISGSGLEGSDAQGHRAFCGWQNIVDER